MRRAAVKVDSNVSLCNCLIREALRVEVMRHASPPILYVNIVRVQSQSQSQSHLLESSTWWVLRTQSIVHWLKHG